MAKLLSVTERYGPFPQYSGAGTLIVQANGGSVSLDVLAEDDPADVWVTQQVISNDDAVKVEMNGTTFRVVPAGGAKFRFVGF